MAGVKGRSGGARKGAGRKPLTLEHLDGGEDALAFLAAVRADRKAPGELRVRAAMVEAQYTHVKSQHGGINKAKGKGKDAAPDEPPKTGRFAPGAAPLRVVGKGEGG